MFAMGTLHQTKAVAQRVVRASGIIQERDSSAQAAIAPDRYRRHLFTKVNVTHNVAYRQTVDHDGHPITLKLDVYAPSADTLKDRPVVLWFHSGGFIAGTKAEESKYATDFAQRGYVSIAVDYRQRPRMAWFDMAQREAAARDAYDDAAAAVNWVHAHASTYGIDPAKIVAAGYSAGAITAFDLAYPPPGAPSVSIAGAVTIAGYTYGRPVAGRPPVLDFHGTADPMIPYSLGTASCDQARSVGNRCDVVSYQGASHDIGNVRREAIEERAADFVAWLTDQSH